MRWLLAGAQEKLRIKEQRGVGILTSTQPGAGAWHSLRATERGGPESGLGELRRPSVREGEVRRGEASTAGGAAGGSAARPGARAGRGGREAGGEGKGSR